MGWWPSVTVQLLLLCNVAQSRAAVNVIWSVNAGGERHTDSSGIKYNKDTAAVGEASDYGRTMTIFRVPQQDQILYQTERYHTSDFSYNIPLKDDGDYVLVLKFSEVWFNAAHQKVFNVQLNGEDVVEQLDIYKEVGRGVAHDEIIPFKVKSKKLIVNGKKSDIVGKSVSLTLVKGYHDNPKLNAAYVAKAAVEEIPTLPPLDTPEEEDELEDEEDGEPLQKPPKPDDKIRKHTSGPKVQNPYAVSDSTSYIIPIFAAVAAFVPLLYCLCKI
ncbi:hypothetical protein EB796_025290 [Bugula neritina]|uniref:Malectin domain-containing protein n=1 Tax=Bugula neritina TaxID=10212 RepID=A0A7J7IS90_BUGNE|nr:hypothetical protein EB796_025290 [Bugula neritina]